MPKTKNSTAKTAKKVKKSYISRDYYSDCFKNDMLYAVLVRSPLSSGKITNVNFSDLPEGYTFFSARDIPGKNHIYTNNIETRVFCAEHVHYLGEPVGILVGPNLSTVRQLANDIQITFDVTTIESAFKEVTDELKKTVANHPEKTFPKDSAIANLVDMMNNLPSLDALPKPDKETSYTQPSQLDSISKQNNHEKHVQQLLAERKVSTGIFNSLQEEEISKFFKEAAYDVSDTWQLKEMVPSWKESSGAFCFTEGSSINVLTTTQWPVHLLKSVSIVLGIEEEKINIQKTICSNEFANGIWRCSTLAVQTALASWLSKKPVKLILSNEEQAKFMKPGLNTKIYHRTALDSEGFIKAMDIKITCDAGFTNPFAQEIADRMTIAASGFYNVENLRIETKVISSENSPTSIYEGMIDSQAFFAIENQIQKIADKTNLLPHELRIKNMNPDPKNQKSPFHYSFKTAEEGMTAIMDQSDFLRKYSSYRLNSIQNNLERGNTFFALPRRGIGMACAFDGSCFYGTNFSLSDQKMEIELKEEGTLIIKATCPSTTAVGVWKKIVHEQLGLNSEQIIIDSDFSVQDETSMPEHFYDDISIMTMLLKKCCQEIKRKKQTGKLPLISKKSITASMKKQWNKENFEGIPFHSASFGSAIVEVELNADTYRGKIKGIWLAIDCGEILSIKAAQSTIRLQVQQELEKLVKGTDISCDEVKISFIQSTDAPKQIGKLVHNLIPAAFSSALSLAFSQTINNIPCTEQQIFDLTTIQENINLKDINKITVPEIPEVQ